MRERAFTNKIETSSCYFEKFVGSPMVMQYEILRNSHSAERLNGFFQVLLKPNSKNLARIIFLVFILNKFTK